MFGRKQAGLAAYGPSLSEMFGQQAGQLVRVLALNAGKLGCVVNFKTAKALGLTPSRSCRADEVIKKGAVCCTCSGPVMARSGG
jgi:hypothetical protein